MATQLLLWARSVLENQDVFAKAEHEMKVAKQKYLAKKLVHDKAALELRSTLTSSPDRSDDDVVSESQSTHGGLF